MPLTPTTARSCGASRPARASRDNRGPGSRTASSTSPSPAAMAASTRSSPATSGLPTYRQAGRCGVSRERTDRGTPMTDKVSKRTAAFSAAVTVAAIAWISMPASAQQQAAVSDQALIGPGKTTYAQKCSHCHGPNLVTAGTVAPDLRGFPDDNTRFTTTVKQGKNNMPPWKDILSDQEITEVWAFVSSRRK